MLRCPKLMGGGKPESVARGIVTRVAKVDARLTQFRTTHFAYNVSYEQTYACICCVSLSLSCAFAPFLTQSCINNDNAWQLALTKIAFRWQPVRRNYRPYLLFYAMEYACGIKYALFYARCNRHPHFVLSSLIDWWNYNKYRNMLKFHGSLFRD